MPPVSSAFVQASDCNWRQASKALLMMEWLLLMWNEHTRSGLWFPIIFTLPGDLVLTRKQSIAFNATEALKVTDCDIQRAGRDRLVPFAFTAKDRI